MTLAEQISEYAEKLQDDQQTVAQRYSTVSELYDLMQLLNTTEEFQLFLSSLVPMVLEQLGRVEVSFESTSYEQKLRHSLLEILNKCIINQSFEPYALDVAGRLLEMLPRENEENGVIITKILTILFKSFKNILNDKVNAFIEIIIQFYKNTPELVEATFYSADSNSVIENGSSNEDEEDDTTSNISNAEEPRVDSTSEHGNILDINPKSSSVDGEVTDTGNKEKRLRPSLKSFKILSECPITMVTLYSSYKHLTTSSLPEFAPYVMNLLKIEVKPQGAANTDADKNETGFTTSTPNVKDNAALNDFILAQIKATSFLAYVFIRGYAANSLQNYISLVPDLIIRLLQDCPPELPSARKELLHATRHILSTNYKKLFLPKLDYLFNKEVLIGNGFTMHETLRPLAYSTVADFIHNIRSELKLNDIEKTIKMYTDYLMDESLALTVQIMSAKLLLNLVERILKLGKENPQEAPRAKKLLMIIVDAYVNRFKKLNRQYNTIMKEHKEFEMKKADKKKNRKNPIPDISDDTKEFMKDILDEDSLEEKTELEKVNDGKEKEVETQDESMDVDVMESSIEIFELHDYLPIRISQKNHNDPVKDAFYLYRTLMSFLKTVVYDLKIFNPPAGEYTLAHPKLWSSVSRVFSYEEVIVLKELFHECIIGLKFFAIDSTPNKELVSKKKHFDITMPSLPVSATKDSRELMDYLAFTFMQIDSTTFNEIINSEMNFLYEQMLEDSALLHIAQSFLTSELTSPNFAGILLRFLKKKLPDLGNTDFNTSNILIRLFKLSFMSVNLFPNINEIVLLPHLNDMILNSLEYSKLAEEPLVYFYLIRTLFRSIGGGRFENLYRSIKPILQVLLQSLNEKIISARLPYERELYVELCITVPVRLSVLAPYLPYLMEPLVYALQEYPDLVSQGLRTLELCIDNLTAEYFDPIIEPVIDQVSKALFKLLQPQPYNHTISHNVVRILGKLGGRNRQFLKPPSNLKISDELDIELLSNVKINGINEPVSLSVTPGVEAAIEIIANHKSSVEKKASAYKYLKSILLLMVKSSLDLPDGYENILSKAIALLKQENVELKEDFKADTKIHRKDFFDQEKLFIKLFESIFFTTSVPELKDEAFELLNQLTDHFCLLQVDRAVHQKRSQSDMFDIDIKHPGPMFSTNIIIKAVCFSLSSYISEVRDVGIQVIKRAYERSLLIFGSELIYQYSIIPDMMKDFIHLCFDETFYNKRAGVLGIQALMNNINEDDKYLKKLQFELVDGLLFVLKDSPNDAPVVITKNAEKLFKEILKFTCKDLTEEDLSSKSLQNTLTDIVCELSNANPTVRVACQKALEIVSETTKIPIVKLMDHSKHFLLSPIFAKPLRALPFTMQIGNLDAVTYCLSLPDTFLQFNEELFRLLQEAIVLADAEDESLSTAQRAAEYKTSQQLTQLRVSCIKLLALALKNEDFANAQQGNIRIRILAVFFKTMLKTSPVIIETTYNALKDALSENSRLPKELLQNGLKPLLMNLSDHQKLTVPGLDALSKLLELLNAYFKVEIGKKLLDHLNAWCRVEVLDTLFGQDIHEQTPTKIIVSIINIFHLLPPQADMFLNDLLLKVMLLERKLRIQLDSPFRVPLAKYMNRFNTSVTEYFKKNMALRQLVIFMCSIIQKDEAKDLASNFEKELPNFYDFYMNAIPSNQVRVVSFLTNMIDIFTTLWKINGHAWLKEQKEFVMKLKNMVTVTLKTISENKFYIDHLQLSQSIENFQKIYTALLSYYPDEPNLFYELIEFLHLHNIKISDLFEDYIFETIISLKDKESQNKLLKQSIEYSLKTKSLNVSVFVFKKIINPSLSFEVAANGNLESYGDTIPDWLDLIDSKIWKTNNNLLLNTTATCHDKFRFELLQLTTILIKYAPKLIENVKRDIIKFSWHFIKLDDIILKQAAYLTTCLYIAEFDFPIKVATQVFVSLLRCSPTEGRYLVKQSLDIIAPIIDERLKSTETPDIWINWVKRVMFENTSSQNIVLYQFIIDHPDLFFKSRNLFVSNIIHQMNKMSFMLNSNPESHVLAIDLASLILRWENKATEITNQQIFDQEGDIKMDEGEENGALDKDPNTSLEPIPMNLRETCIAFLIRYICASNNRAADSELGSRTLQILSEFLSEQRWANVNVKLDYFEKFLLSPDLETENILYYCINALDVLYICFKNKPSKWIYENLANIENLLSKCIKVHHHDIQEALQKVLTLILRAIKEEEKPNGTEEEQPGMAFVSMLTTTVEQKLQETASVAAGVTIAWTVFMVFQESIEPLIMQLMKTFSKLCKDQLSINQPKDAVTMEEAQLTTKLLEKVLFILSLRISSLGDSRRPFLSTVALLIDHSTDQKFLREIICITRYWIFNGEVFPTVKEKAAILTKMLAFEIKGEPRLSKLFYDTILKLFEKVNPGTTEITSRMEQPFLVGTCTQHTDIRKKFMKILNNSIKDDIRERIYYIICDLNWEFIADFLWLNQALQLLYGAIPSNQEFELTNAYKLSTPVLLEQFVSSGRNENTEEHISEEFSAFLKLHNSHISELCSIKCSDIFDHLVELFYESPEAVHKAWINLFPEAYKSIPKDEKYGFIRSVITLLAKPYHTRQNGHKVNVINILLDSFGRNKDFELPPHLLKYLAISYNSWYQSINILESMQSNPQIENNVIIETSEDALLELYMNLQEEEMFYGLWRRKAKYTETTMALSYEQVGLWEKAQQLYEVAMTKARSGALPYSESEYALWEDNWIICAQKLQQWDVLTELAKHEGFTDLLLECGWRVADWNTDREALEQSVKSVMDVPTPRRHIFKTFLALQNFADTRKGDQDVRKLCGEGIQLCLQKWISLPERYTPSHQWLLHGFQQYIEFMEATQIYANLHTTTVQNLDAKAQEIKRVLQAWRDRLPNIWDDVNMWNDLVTWRQHVFQVINNSYLPLIPALQQANSNGNVNTHAYRGYHEIAWVINRFAHVARKHYMPDVCINQLARIYTLPNIEIQEAFLKLREQAKCHYQNMNELTTGLDVISNTNLVYFGTVQKAEFFTLKGMFLSKLRAYDEANQAFATAVQIDLNLAKAWAQWGFFNDRRLAEEPNNVGFASNAISCYLQAAGLYKNSKIHELLCRILWLISMDDSSGSIANAFESFRGEVPVWYWITFIPQLLTSLSHKEANMVRQILIRIAKSYPQALHFQLRTTKEDFAVIQRQTMAVANEKKDKQQDKSNSGNSDHRQPWEYLQELNNILKTAYPLLALSLESLVAQINERFKTSTDEDLFRLINVLLIDGTFNYNRLPFPRGKPKLPTATESNLMKFANTLLAPYIRPKFNADFIESKPDFETYIKRLRYWRKRLESKLDRAPAVENLERICPHLSNFHHQKFEDIEIPGQYLLNKDNNLHFIKIARFLSSVDFVHGTHFSYRRITIRGHDGSLHPFAVQYPAVRHSRREERMFQLYRLLNKSLSRNVETRRRNIEFQLPVAVPLSPQVRIMNDSSSFVTMQQIYDEYCEKSNIDPYMVQDFISEKLNTAYDKALPPPDATVLKVEIYNSIQSLYVPTTVLKDYFSGLFSSFEDFWLFRKQFSSQYAAFVFMSFMMMINGRTPHKIHIDQKSGNVFTLEMLPSRYPYERVKPLLKNLEFSLPQDTPIFHNNEPVPFRLTSNVQKLIGDSALEGIFSVHLFSIARALIEPENELQTFLALFIRDEIISWYSNLHRPIIENPQLRDMVQTNVDLIVRRVTQMGHVSSTPSVTTQFVLDCISASVNPRNLAKADVSFMPWF
ncbi:Transcription-associated protein 1 [Nakaseomyces bracarensis]|uniref:Transcription-associated protein 1 n=1 Tax=Nakaseomyces bracarensis TaxID=273131 RepID=A0ABR4NSD1_9SACH